MSLLAKIFGAVPKEERTGISMGDAVGWEVSGIKSKSLPEFLRPLPTVLPEHSILYLEGTSRSAREVIAFLESHAASETSKVALGTIWPRPKFFHVPVTPEIMGELATLSARRVTPEVCIHVHAYIDGRVLLEWYDAFFQELWISRDITEDRVAVFSKRVGAQYRRV